MRRKFECVNYPQFASAASVFEVKRINLVPRSDFNVVIEKCNATNDSVSSTFAQRCQLLVSSYIALQVPLGLSNAATPLMTPRSIQPAMVVGFVSRIEFSFNSADEVLTFLFDIVFRRP